MSRNQRVDWACETCTYADNPELYLSCSLCGSERPLTAQDTAFSSTILLPLSPSSAARLSHEKEYSIEGMNLDGESSPRALSKDSGGLGVTNIRRFAKHSPNAHKDNDKEEEVDIERWGSRRGCDKNLESLSSDHGENDRDVSVLCDRDRNAPSSPPGRLPPEHVVPINNLSDRQYCCVWSVEILDGGWRPDVARTMLAAVARHINPILRHRGWRVKRLIESCSRSWIGCCTTNGRNDADAASVNIQLNLRHRPDRTCRHFRTFGEVLAVMLHEVTHTSVGLEDIHPPAFWELLKKIKAQYLSLLREGEVDLETDPYGCNETVIVNGSPQRIYEAALQIDREQGLGLAGALRVPSAGPSSLSDSRAELGESVALFSLVDSNLVQNCGASRRSNRRRRLLKRHGGDSRRDRPGSPRRLAQRPRTTATTNPRRVPLRKGAKMVDGRTRDGKRVILEKMDLAPRELVARAALHRLGGAIQVADAPRIAPSALEAELSSSSSNEMDDQGEVPVDGDDDSLTCSILYHRHDEIEISSSDESIAPHSDQCACRSCQWEKTLCQPAPRPPGL